MKKAFFILALALVSLSITGCNNASDQGPKEDCNQTECGCDKCGCTSGCSCKCNP